MKALKGILCGIVVFIMVMLTCVACDLPMGDLSVTVKDGEQTVKVYEFSVNELISIPTSDLAKPGYDVSGLYTDVDMTQEFTSGVINAEADMTLYVSYTPKSYYMMVDNGTGDEVRVNVTYGNSYQLTAPIRDGYRFIQYSYMGEEFPMNGTYNYTNSIPVVAKWEKIVYINVYDGVSFTKVEVAADGKFELPDVDDTDEKIFAIKCGNASCKSYTFP